MSVSEMLGPGTTATSLLAKAQGPRGGKNFSWRRLREDEENSWWWGRALYNLQKAPSHFLTCDLSREDCRAGCALLHFSDEESRQRLVHGSPVRRGDQGSGSDLLIPGPGLLWPLKIPTNSPKDLRKSTKITLRRACNFMMP